MANKNYFMNGITELLVLSILKNSDTYVYDIVKSVEDFSGGLLNISQNTIYTATYKLEKDRHITEYSKLVGRKRTRVYYHIEKSGLLYLNELMEIYNNTIAGVSCVLKVLKGGNGNE